MYNQIAHYYELTHADLTEDVAWVMAKAQEADGAVLELGCGSGRLLLPLAHAGVEVVGVDNSPAMLAIAQRKLAASGTVGTALVEADMTALALPKRDFGLALIPYNTLMHIPPLLLGRALRVIRAHVRPNGKLLIDTANPLWLASTADSDEAEEERQFTDPTTGELVTQYASYRGDPAAQIFHIEWLFVAQNEAGEKRETVATAAYHYYYPHQLQLALAEAGWQLRHMLGSYAGEPFDEESERLILEAEAPSP